MKINTAFLEKVILNEKGQPMFRTDNGDVSVETKGYTKDLTVKVIIKREAYSERTLQLKVGYFVATYRCKMPRDRALKYCYFYFDPKVMDNVALRDFNTNTTFTINVMSKETAKLYGIKQINQPKRVSEAEANHMLLNKQVLPQIYSDDGSCGQTVSL